jgi:hypothetical protein
MLGITEDEEYFLINCLKGCDVEWMMVRIQPSAAAKANRTRFAQFASMTPLHSWNFGRILNF